MSHPVDQYKQLIKCSLPFIAVYPTTTTTLGRTASPILAAVAPYPIAHHPQPKARNVANVVPVNNVANVVPVRNVANVVPVQVAQVPQPQFRYANVVPVLPVHQQVAYRY